MNRSSATQTTAKINTIAATVASILIAIMATTTTTVQPAYAKLVIEPWQQSREIGSEAVFMCRDKDNVIKPQDIHWNITDIDDPEHNVTTTGVNDNSLPDYDVTIGINDNNLPDYDITTGVGDSIINVTETTTATTVMLTTTIVDGSQRLLPRVSQANGTLTIRNLRLGDTGLYVCEAREANNNNNNADDANGNNANNGGSGSTGSPSVVDRVLHTATAKLLVYEMPDYLDYAEYMGILIGVLIGATAVGHAFKVASDKARQRQEKGRGRRGKGKGHGQSKRVIAASVAAAASATQKHSVIT